MPWTKVAIESSYKNYLSREVSNKERIISYRDALKEALEQALERDPNVFLMGEGVDDSGGVFGSTLGLRKKFGGRVFDTPIAENALTGIATGAALSGMRPVLVHMRMDFLPVSFDQIINHASKLCYMSGGRVSVPIVIRSIIGKGWGSAAQHSQSLHALFMHMPGVKVVMPASPYDAKGLLLSSIADNNPVIFIEHRWLYDMKGYVPEKEYIIPFGKGSITKKGKDATIVAFSLMVAESMRAAAELEKEGISVEIIDPRTIRPFDTEIVISSVKKTGRLIIADLGWRSGGMGEIMAGRLHNEIRKFLKSDVQIIASPDTPTPSSHHLEKIFHKDAGDIIKAVRKVLA
jgi:acetoin:2,6-dichlorophenolindophenol oxidoreductase subunit beta